MTKKTYQKPKMLVYPLMEHAPLICVSKPGGSGDSSYIPRINEDLNKLA